MFVEDALEMEPLPWSGCIRPEGCICYYKQAVHEQLLNYNVAIFANVKKIDLETLVELLDETGHDKIQLLSFPNKVMPKIYRLMRR
jgi:hypothetical protein